MVAAITAMWSDYRDHLVGERLSEKTIARYVRWVRDADEWLRREQGMTLREAPATAVRAWSEVRVSSSHASRGQAAAALRHYWEMVDRDRPPIRAIRVPPTPQYECRAITESQVRDVVKVAVGWWPQGTVVLAGLYLALRRFEISRMEWLRFSSDGAWYRVTGKYDKTADLPVHPILWGELAGRKGSSPYVFPGRFPGRPIHPATVWEWTRRVGEAAGVGDLEPHELRHTALATANDNLGDLRAVQTFARHSDPATTAIYTRTRRDRLVEVSDSLDYV